MAARPEPARFVKVRCWRRFSEGGRRPTQRSDMRVSTNPEWQLAIDQDPQMAVETRRKIINRAVTDKLTIRVLTG
jgi:hypothetical protein